MFVVPVGEGVDAFADALRVDVTLADQTLSRLNHSFDPVQVELHGGGEVLVLLYGSFNCFHCGGQFYVSERRLLENKHEIYRGDKSTPQCFPYQRTSDMQLSFHCSINTCFFSTLMFPLL